MGEPGRRIAQSYFARIDALFGALYVTIGDMISVRARRAASSKSSAEGVDHSMNHHAASYRIFAKAATSPIEELGVLNRGAA